MVNTGHPSRACKLCRQRRIKCDETKPFCIKCKKSKRTCPGYRDPFEINLRDETQSTIRKAKAAAQRRPSEFEQESSPDETLTKSPVGKQKCHQRNRSTSTHCSEASWSSFETGAEPTFELNSTWSSPSSVLASPDRPYNSTNGVETWEFSPISTYSTLAETEFDFNAAAWAPATTSFAVPIKTVCEELSKWDVNSSQNGTIFSFGEASGAESVGKSNELMHVLPGLQTPLDEQATCFLLSNFVLRVSAGQSPGIFSFILTIIQSPGIKNTPFPMAFAAVSLAALAGRPNSRHLLPKSRVYYSTALIQMKEVLKNKRLAKEDTSLATAILLSFYEVLACDDEDNMHMAGWSQHLDGAKALIRLRGKEVIANSTPEGLEMFQTVRSMSVRQYMFGFVANPQIEEVEFWGQHIVSDKQGHLALVLNMKTTLIRAEADALLTSGPKTAQKIDKALDLLRRAKGVVTELGRWLENCHPTWPKFISGWAGDIPVEELILKSPVYPGLPIYKFPNVWVAGKHINTNASRILLAGIIIRCTRWICAPSDHTKTSDFTDATRIGLEEVANVIASVPYFVDWSGDYSTTPFFPCGAPTSPKAYSGVTALYPLLTTGLSEFATPSQKRWLCRRLDFMAESMGIKQAEVFSKFISRHAALGTI